MARTYRFEYVVLPYSDSRHLGTTEAENFRPHCFQ